MRKRNRDVSWRCAAALFAVGITSSAFADISFGPPVKVLGPGFRAARGLSAAAGDFNGDRLPDLIVQGSGQNGIYFNRGTAREPKFTGLDVPLPSSGYLVSVVDFNGDGKLDVAFGKYICLNIGTSRKPRFAADVNDAGNVRTINVPSIESQLFHSTLFVDGDGDGILDLIADLIDKKEQDKWGHRLCRLMFARGKGKKSREFGPFVPVRGPDGLVFSDHSAAVTLLTAKQGLKLLTANYEGECKVLSGLTVRDDRVDVGDVQTVARVKGIIATAWAGDLDGDRIPDILSGVYASRIFFLRGKGYNAYEPQIELRGGCFPPAPHHGFALADINADGILDLVRQQMSGTLLLEAFPGLAATVPSFGPAATLPLDDGGRLELHEAKTPAAPAFADLDANQSPDLLLASWTADKKGIVRVFFSEARPEAVFSIAPPLGRETEPLLAQDGPVTFGAPGNLCVADMNHDGLPDLLVGGTTGMVRTNGGAIGRPVFGPAQPLLDTDGKPISGYLAAGDVDGDGLTDLAVGLPGSSRLSFYRGTLTDGTLRFNTPTVIASLPEAQADGIYPVIVPARAGKRGAVWFSIATTFDIFVIHPQQTPT